MEFNDSLLLAKLILLIALIAVCSATDLSTRRIPNAVLLPALMASLFLNGFADGLAGLFDSVAGLAIGLLMLMPLHVLGRMGAGDIKLLGVVGSILGAWGAVVAGLATMMAGAVVGLAYLAWLCTKPAAVAGILRVKRMVTGQSSVSDFVPLSQNIRATEIPYAVAIAAGTFAALHYLDLLSEVGIT